MTDEFNVVSYTSGKGKDADAIIWICETSSAIQFKCTPKGIDYEKRRELFTAAEKNFSEFLNRLMTVEYQALSKLGVPQRAKAIGFRDFTDGKPNY
jgi:hypothetical protein